MAFAWSQRSFGHMFGPAKKKWAHFFVISMIGNQMITKCTVLEVYNLTGAIFQKRYFSVPYI